MAKGAIFIGIFLVLVGLWGSYVIVSSKEPVWIVAYPLVAVGLGIAMIIFNKEEQKIEQRKDLKYKELSKD